MEVIIHLLNTALLLKSTYNSFAKQWLTRPAEKQVINGLRGDLKHEYPGRPNQYTELEESEKNYMT